MGSFRERDSSLGNLSLYSSFSLVTAMLAHEVLDPKNTLPHVKYCHLTPCLHLLRYEYYIVNIPRFSPLRVGRDNPDWSWWTCKTLMRL